MSDCKSACLFLCVFVCSSFRKAPTFSLLSVSVPPYRSHSYIFYDTKSSTHKTSLFPNLANYEKQCHELFTLYEQDKLAACLEQGQRNLRDLPMPSYWRIKTWYILAGAESDWKKAEVSYPDRTGGKTTRDILLTTMIYQAWRQKAETLYRSLPKEEMDSRWNKNLRASLDELRDYQAVDAPDWFLAKERLDAMFRDEKERRADRDEEQTQSTSFFSESETDDEDEDEDEDEETESDFEGESPDDGNLDDLGMTMEEMTIMNAYQEAAATKEKSAKDPAEVGMMK
jgi:hypothetical protein